MKKFFLLFSILFLFCQAAISQTLPKNITVTLVPSTTHQTLTESWANAGSEISVKAFKTMTLCTQLDINDSTNFRVKVLYKTATGGTLYNSMILNPSASVVSLEPEYYELNVDADGNYCFDVGVRSMNFVQVQVQVGDLGEGETPTAGVVLAMYAQLSE